MARQCTQAVRAGYFLRRQGTVQRTGYCLNLYTCTRTAKVPYTVKTRCLLVTSIAPLIVLRAVPTAMVSAESAGRMVGQGSSTMELVYGSISGMAFGLVSPIASQPFDTLKTKMQAESRFARQGMGTVLSEVMKSNGVAGLYRGIMPIIMSTGVQKSALFSANAGARRACEQSGILALRNLYRSRRSRHQSLSAALRLGRHEQW